MDSNAIVFWKFIDLQCIYYAAAHSVSIAMHSEVGVRMLLAATKIFSLPHQLM